MGEVRSNYGWGMIKNANRFPLSFLTLMSQGLRCEDRPSSDIVLQDILAAVLI